MVEYVLLGCFTAYFVLRDQGIERALAVHLANNLFLFWVVGYPDAVIATEPIFMTKEVMVVPGLIQSVVMLGLFTWVSDKNYRNGR